MAKKFWTSEHSTDVIAENLVPNPFCFGISQILKSVYRDWLQEWHLKSINEVQHRCWAAPAFQFFPEVLRFGSVHAS